MRILKENPFSPIFQMMRRSFFAVFSPVFLTTLCFSPLPAMAGKIIDSRFITSDTVWEGNITVRGIVKVAQGTTLTIRPGAVISFTRLDRDEDGLGDNALFLRGRLLARGTKENPILFTSAETKKKRGDWDGINIIVSDRVQNILEFCRVEYAIRGLHSHFANFIISNCEFSDNFRGIYFQEAKAIIENSRVTGNLSGMRCRDSDLVLRDSEFSQGYWGADILQSRVLIVGNSFVDNLLYGLRVRAGKGEISANIFERNQLGLRFQESVIRMKKNRIQNNYETGISFLTSEVTAQDNNIMGNAATGVLARQSTLNFTANTLVNNGVGLSLLASARADLAFNLINSNTGNGITASKSRLLLRNNRIINNENGVRVKNSPSTNLIGNLIQSNRQNGLSAEGSEVVFQRDILMGNENGVNTKNSSMVFRQTTLKNNRIAGLDARENSIVSIYGSLITGNKEVGITAKNKTIEITDSRISENGYGIKIEDSDSLTVLRSTLYNNLKSGIRTDYAKGMIVDSIVINNKNGIICNLSDLAITANQIKNNRQKGILATDSITVLSGNRIEGNRVGITCIRSESAVVAGNLIQGNSEEGVFIQDVSDASVTENRFTGNGIGIRVDNSRVRFSGNSFGENRSNTFSLLGSMNVDAHNNWWGTVDEKQIEDMISDINDGRDTGEVFFYPYLQDDPYFPGIERE